MRAIALLMVAPLIAAHVAAAAAPPIPDLVYYSHGWATTNNFVSEDIESFEKEFVFGGVTPQGGAFNEIVNMTSSPSISILNSVKGSGAQAQMTASQTFYMYVSAPEVSLIGLGYDLRLSYHGVGPFNAWATSYAGFHIEVPTYNQGAVPTGAGLTACDPQLGLSNSCLSWDSAATGTLSVPTNNLIKVVFDTVSTNGTYLQGTVTTFADLALSFGSLPPGSSVLMSAGVAFPALPAPIPEPSTYAMLLMGLAGVCWKARRSRH